MLLSEAKSRCWAEIDLDALLSNYNAALSLLAPGARLICVLKANAYGLGAKKVSRVLYGAGARFFAVACFSEAEEIKTQLPGAEVMVLGLAGREEILRAIHGDIILTAWSPEGARLIEACAREAGKPARVHIKTDTGLHRLGFDESSANEMTAFAVSPFIKVEGLYTHLALRDRENDDRQFGLFDRLDKALAESGRTGYMRHACDSIGMVRYPSRHMDAVRIGAWLYGVCPNGYAHPEQDRLALRFMTRVSDLHRVQKGECIGYDEDHPLTRDSLVATLSAGYVDGYPRFNNIGEVIIRGKRAPVLGLVCMDQMMVDVTDIEGVERGDEVTLLGGGIPLNEYASLAKFNRNECLCRMGRRVPKVYTLNGVTDEITVDI